MRTAGDVLLVDVEHDVRQAAAAQVVEPEHGDRLRRDPGPVIRGHRHDVDLADRAVGRVDLGPVEGRDPVRGVRLDDEDEARRGPTTARPSAARGRPAVSEPCSGWWANAAALTASQASSSRPGSKVRRSTPRHGAQPATADPSRSDRP